ncbi:MAG: homogentisate 1,2-dioxygenase [Gemmataceae bacterium]|nr:homogentisate 1,2-dioxygenase [Gemmataceae bacterium]
MYYMKLGQVPAKRHTQLLGPKGELRYEQVVTTHGFDHRYACLYHLHPPTRVMEVVERPPQPIELVPQKVKRHVHLRPLGLKPGGDAISGRNPLLANADVTLAICRPTEKMAYFYRPGDCDEIIFIHQGQGTLQTWQGNIPFAEGDYLVIPRGTTYRFDFSGSADPEALARMLVIRTPSMIRLPSRYVNPAGQLRLGAPFYERDIRPPSLLQTHEETGGPWEVRVQTGDQFTGYLFDFHPFDVVGWDGYCYPWAFNIYNYEPLAGRVHLPPPFQQTFQADRFVVCSFCPRMLEDHPQAIKVPYVHSNVDSDEVLYYVNGNFSSRRGIGVSSITLHPSGIPHGPHPGAIEASLKATRTEELAVMVDTFAPLQLTTEALQCDQADYPMSWK